MRLPLVVHTNRVSSLFFGHSLQTRGSSRCPSGRPSSIATACAQAPVRLRQGGLGRQVRTARQETCWRCTNSKVHGEAAGPPSRFRQGWVPSKTRTCDHSINGRATQGLFNGAPIVSRRAANQGSCGPPHRSVAFVEPLAHKAGGFPLVNAKKSPPARRQARSPAPRLRGRAGSPEVSKLCLSRADLAEDDPIARSSRNDPRFPEDRVQSSARERSSFGHFLAIANHIYGPVAVHKLTKTQMADGPRHGPRGALESALRF